MPDLFFIIDPIDNTDGAIHGSPAYTAVSIYQRSANTVIAAAVGDFLQREIYYADEELPGACRYRVAQTIDEDERTELKPSARTELPGSYITLYTLKPQRLLEAARAKDLINQLGPHGRIDCIGGAAALCKVAAGSLDAAIEFAKGFQVYDLFPGAYILSKAGGVCPCLDTGNAVSLALSFDAQDQLSDILRGRQRFVAAATETLSRKILLSLGKNQLTQ